MTTVRAPWPASTTPSPWGPQEKQQATSSSRRTSTSSGGSRQRGGRRDHSTALTHSTTRRLGTRASPLWDPSHFSSTAPDPSADCPKATTPRSPAPTSKVPTPLTYHTSGREITPLLRGSSESCIPPASPFLQTYPSSWTPVDTPTTCGRSIPPSPSHHHHPSLQTCDNPSSSPNTSTTRRAGSSPVPHVLWPLLLALVSSGVSAASPRGSSGLPYRLTGSQSHNESIAIFFSPPAIASLRVNTRQRVFFNFTLLQQARTPHGRQSDQSGSTAGGQSSGQTGRELTTAARDSLTSTPSAHGSNDSTHAVREGGHGQKGAGGAGGSSGRYWVMIWSGDERVARPVLSNNVKVRQSPGRGWHLVLEVTQGMQHNFSVEARHLGRVTMSVAVVEMAFKDRRLDQTTSAEPVASSQYPVTAVRGERTADLVFNSSVAAIAILISFGIGACTDGDSLKRQLKAPVALIIAFCCQFILMPLLSFGLAMLLPLDKEIQFGLLCVACVPGGGLSHVAVIIADGDTALSLTINLIAVLAMLGTAPLWIFVLGQYFQTDAESALSPRTIPIYKFEVWLVAKCLAYVCGLAVRKFRPHVAEAVLMWLIKPCLLLASILYITLGVYINMYVFELVHQYALLGAMLLPLCGCVLGAVTASVCRQSYAFVKTIALETSSLNCLLVMVALRFTLEQPDADLAAMIPIWVMFTIPGLFVCLAVCTKVKATALHYWRQRHKDSDVHGSSKAYSVTSSVVSPPGTTTLSAPLVMADCMDDELTGSSASNQKVTVL